MTDYEYYKQQMAAYNYAKSQEEMAKLKEQSDKKSLNFWKALAPSMSAAS